MTHRVEELLQSVVVKRTPPVNLTVTDRAYFAAEMSKDLPAVSIYEFEEVAVTEDGVVLEGMRACRDLLVSPSHARQFGFAFAVRTYATKRGVPLPDSDRYLQVHDYWSSGYFHWMTDALPRLLALGERTRDLILLLPERFGPFHQATLEAFDLKDIYLIPGSTYVKVPRLVSPSHTAPTGNYNEKLIRELRARYQQHSAGTHVEFPAGPIYVSRSSASRRRVRNEDEVTDVLSKHGFASIRFEDYSFEEQVAIAQRATLMVSIHGAGLTNMMFMEPGSSILEFRLSGDSSNLCYFSLASALGLRYAYLFGESAEDASAHEADLVIDIDQLDWTVKVMMGR